MFVAWSAVSVRALAITSADFACRSSRNCATICSGVGSAAGAAAGASADQAGNVIANATIAMRPVFVGCLRKTREFESMRRVYGRHQGDGQARSTGHAGGATVAWTSTIDIVDRAGVRPP